MTGGGETNRQLALRSMPILQMVLTKRWSLGPRTRPWYFPWS